MTVTVPGTTSRYVNPLTDFGFKHLLGSEPNKDIMIEFLNAIFAGQKKIIDLIFSPTEYAASTEEYKKVFFDLMCTGKDGDQFIIEMQRRDQSFFQDRCIYYLSRLVSQQLPKGESNWDVQLKEVYLIAILEFRLNSGSDDRYLHDIALMNKDTGKVFYDRLGFKFLELPNFDKEVHELVSDLDKWFYILKNMSRMEKIPLYFNKGIFKKLFKIAEVSKLTEVQRKLYESNLKAKWDYENSIAFARKEEGKKARIEGHEEGRQEGLKEGLQEGILLIARKQKQKNIPIVEIAELTGLSIEEIEKL